MNTPTPLDALKSVCLSGIDQLEYVTEQFLISFDIDEDEDVIAMLDNIKESMHRALQSQVTYRLAPPIIEGSEAYPHSNTYEAARMYSDGSPVYSDEPCTVPMNDENGMTHLVQSTRRVFKPLPGGAA